MTLKLFSIQNPHFEDLRDDVFPATLRIWRQETLQLSSSATHFGYVFQGQCGLHRGECPVPQPFPLQPGMYFCLPGAGRLDGATSAGFVVTCPDYQGMFSLGGPIEAGGRLAYINGGTNSVLISPPRLGDPSLHAMYLPANIEQTLHTHPSYRIGIVVSGMGHVAIPAGANAIAPGDIFLIPPHHEHCFYTGAEGLTAVVFHPDSEAGFSHRDNPMLQRTIVEGISAVALPHLQTPIS